jgi:arginyl-tRNA synthetase
MAPAPATSIDPVTPDDLIHALRAAVVQCVNENEFAAEVPVDVGLDRPKNRNHGDYASNVAMRLAKTAGKPPRIIAEAIAQVLVEAEGVAAVDVAGPGFLNITLEAGSLGELARTIVEKGSTYGQSEILVGQNVNLEFVSANPTGPIHMGGTRWAAVGDSLARILQASGAAVSREYYFNDHGVQIDRFARSLLAAATDGTVPEDGYSGGYITDIAKQVAKDHPEIESLPNAEAQEVFRSAGVEMMFGEIKASLHNFGVDFDVYFHENSLHESGAVERAVGRLRDEGHIFEADGAIWLRTTDFGDDKDRVIIKSDGEHAYLAGDLAYYLDKRERGFDRCLVMLGADHHGYVGRLMAMCACFGDTPGVNLQVLIGQMVNLVKDGQAIRMSKRAGTVVTLEDLVEAVGVDAGRYALARASADSSLDIDLDLLARATNENPVFYVQYAHARLSSLQRNASELGILRSGQPDLSLLNHDREIELLGALGELPRVIATAAELRQPHRIARYLEDVAGRYHRFYDACRVLPMGDDPANELTHARLWLCEATRIVLANGLALLGVSSPERM